MLFHCHIDEESGISTGCVATYLSLITYHTNNISSSIEELSVEPSDMTDMKEDLFIVRFPIGLDYPLITLPFQGC